MSDLTSVIFVSDPKEIIEVKKILTKKSVNQPIVISSTPEASSKLTECNIKFLDSDIFYPNSGQVSHWHHQLLKLCLTWHLNPKINTILNVNYINIGQICELGIHIYLGEIGHSVLTAQNLLNRLRPKLIYVNNGFSESPYRRYQTESLNLESTALNLLADQMNIKTVHLGRRSILSFMPKALMILRQLSSSLIFDFRHFFLKLSTQLNTDFIFIGNHYQLINLLPTLIAAKTKIRFIATGKANTDVADQVEANKVPFFNFAEFMSSTRLFFDSLKFLSSWFIIKSSLKNIFSSPDPIIWKLIEPKMWWYFLNEFAEIANVVRTANNLLTCNPKALITMATSDHFSRAIALSAIKRGVPVIELQHGLYRIDVEYPFRSNSFFLTWSEKERSILHHGETHPEHYPLASYPWFDQYRNIKNSIDSLRKKGRRLFGYDNNDNVIIILATFPHDLDDDRLAVSISPFKYLTMVFEAINKLPDKWKVIFRPHPSSKSEWVKELAVHYGISLFYDNRNLPLKISLAASDIVITNFTTAILDAILMNRPIFIHTLIHIYKKHLENFPSIKSKTVCYFDTSDQLKELILKSQKLKFKINLLGKKYYLKHYVNPTDRPANEQVIDYLLKFTK